ncbi:MAG: UDP-glucose--hexose-1-phosphate uridylyltransferase [Planctomycetia bacterium]|nr:UDP-glucose--hexose-1-phosphate uridylyltransferase [Planctomycetia bacterium]
MILSEYSSKYPHRRYDPLRGEWVLVSPHRTERPWLGNTEKKSDSKRLSYDPGCYLCPGNVRASGAVNPSYTTTFVFQNDFQALLSEIPDLDPSETVTQHSDIFQSTLVRGECRVICFSPRHDLTLPKMEETEIASVIDLWKAQAAELLQKYRWVQIFENKGDIMGCSNPHPHGQIWASSSLPNILSAEEKNLKVYYEKHASPLLLDYLSVEEKEEERILVKNEDWAVVVPFWAVWPYETLLLPRVPIQRITQITDRQRDSLAAILKQFLGLYDRLFDTSFPYSMGWHYAPGPVPENELTASSPEIAHWTLHAHFYPPLLRSATVKKHMVGYEMLCEPQRDITPEKAAKTLRELLPK